MENQDVFLNLVEVHPKTKSLREYGLYRVEPKTLNRQVKFRLAANVAKVLGNENSLVFSVGDRIYSSVELKNLGPFSETLDVAGTQVTFSAELVEEVDEPTRAPSHSTESERLVNRLVDWYFKETNPTSFRIENATFKAENLFFKLQNNLYRTYKINVNEGYLRAARTFGGSMYLLFDTEYRVTWEQNLWEDVKSYVVNNLNSNLSLPNEATIRRVNEKYGRFNNKPGVRVQGVNRVGEYEVLEFDFTKNPTTPGTVGDKGLSQEEYFNRAYAGEVSIKDKTQPLVRVRSTKGYYRNNSTYHVPELLEFDRIPMNVRSNVRVNSAISNIMKPLPRSRFAHLLSFIQGDPFGKTKGIASNSFVNSFVTINPRPVVTVAQKLDPIVVKMGDEHFPVESESDFLGKMLKGKFHRTVNPKKVGLLFLSERKDRVLAFYDKLATAAESRGLVLPKDPQLEPVDGKDYKSFTAKIPSLQDCDIVISFGSINEDMLYNAIKKQLLVKHGVLSQHITYEKTVDPLSDMELQGKEDTANIILLMIAMQLCAKLGGAPWAFEEPIFEENCPMIGLDVFHRDDGSITGACAAFDPHGEYLFSDTTLASVPSPEAFASMDALLSGVLERYTKMKGKPSKVFLIRDGLSFTQEQLFLHGAEGELAVIEQVLRAHGVDDYVFVMEKVQTNLRMFKKITDVKVENPNAGTVLIGSPFDANEMLMVAQESYVGTVNPVFYKVLNQGSSNMIRIANSIYKLSRHHWVTARSIKIPAPAYHADSITYLIRNVLEASPKSRAVLDRPFYL